MKVDIAGVLVDNITKQQSIERIDDFVKSGSPHYVVTPYSEFIVFAQRDSKYKEALNSADLSLPDGVGILWAAKYLSLAPGYDFLKLKLSLFRLLLSPAYGRTIIKERVVGSHLIWDIAKLASDKNYAISLIGGKGTVAAQTAFELKKKFPNLKVPLALSDKAFDDKIVSEINESNSDILLIAYSPPKQEIWLAENIKKLKVKVAVGLGGTFDYVAHKRLPAPGILHNLGLEWFWRLITQPWRLGRMWNALPVFIWTVYKYKLITINYGSRSKN